MDVLRVTAIGKDVAKLVEQKMELSDIKTVNTVSTSMFGNLTAITYEIEMREEDVIRKRGKLMDKMAEDNLRLMPMYVHGDWMRIIVMKPLIK